MRIARRRWLGLALLSAVGPGCRWLSATRTERAEPPHTTAEKRFASERVVLDYRLIDQPAGDPFATDRLWTIARNPLSHETTALLAENGLRVGLVSGVIPPEFTERVAGERYALDPRAIVTRFHEEKILPINGPIATAEVAIVSEIGQPARPETWLEAECGLSATARPGRDGGATVEFQLVAQSGRKQSWLRPNGDRTKFVWDQQKTRTELTGLAWTLTPDRGDFLVIGPTASPAGTLGELFFFDRQIDRARQRFFVVRINHIPTADANPTGAIAARVGR
jgi:hypothetical protein